MWVTHSCRGGGQAPSAPHRKRERAAPKYGMPQNERYKTMFERYRKIQQETASGEREEGFTLIELLIVIVVLGILAAIVIFSLTGVTGTSAVAACVSDAKTVEIAVSAFNAEN